MPPDIVKFGIVIMQKTSPLNRLNRLEEYLTERLGTEPSNDKGT